MSIKIIDKPIIRNEKSLALATKDEILADLLIRQGEIESMKNSKKLIIGWQIKHQIKWISILQKELRSRFVIDVE